jgi:ABC-type glycerol-3-phosphate transport system substrate-binding protein
MAAGCIAAALTLAACGSSPGPAPDTSSTSTTTVPTTSTTTSTVPAQSLSIAAFYSPTMNINCELPQATITNVFCETSNPPRTVVMTPDGSLTQGTSIGNAGVGTPVLPYGSSPTVAPFTCRSEPGGVTCTTTGGKGFTIAQSGITPVG